jgi:hypothetical protein
VYFLQMVCMAERNSWPYLDFVAVSMLAKSVSTSYGTPMLMPYVAVCAAFDCKSSMLMLIFLQKSKVWLITLRSCSSTSFVDGWLAPSMATCITSNSVKSLMLLWSLPLAVCRMASVMSLPTSFVMASTAPYFAPMTD